MEYHVTASAQPARQGGAMNILVTGGLGVNGCWVTRQLLEMGHNPVVFDVRPDFSLVSDIASEIEVVQGDVTDFAAILRALKGPPHRADLPPGRNLPRRRRREPRPRLPRQRHHHRADPRRRPHHGRGPRGLHQLARRLGANNPGLPRPGAQAHQRGLPRLAHQQRLRRHQGGQRAHGPEL